MLLRTARERRLLIIGLIATLALVWRLAAGSHPVDDAYITFRYAPREPIEQFLSGLRFERPEWI